MIISNLNNVDVRPAAINVGFLYAKNGTGGMGVISGVITEEGLPVVRRVICYHRKTGVKITQTWSGVDGVYRFDGLISGVKYFITSIDENSDSIQYNAVTQDLITASEVTQ